ncbi:hypothetical protein D8B26_006039 [Coccidioides posadasii str. Silveira]|uniref:Uncharacterized protein n=1 Tax=Coccidioides posadasii (strain RMSCC 757 / Silveira) TaxID=443226 RepID=E9DBW5_COCPS|nr:conserved hypothetical protein [Coccidioides posadasii str. Silveira]QVM11391.1 hypothetical protein D8B26_006039 [Coccidioides posadasii str. Silveira]
MKGKRKLKKSKDKDAQAVAESLIVSNNDAVPLTDYDYENDLRPEFSPYTEDCCYLLVGESCIRYTVPTHHLKKSPHLSSRAPERSFTSHRDYRTIEVPELDEDIGHTLVHFLYTDEYQTLKHPISSKAETKATEYRRSILVYQAASAYGLPLLLERAKERINEFDNAVSIFEALDIAKIVYEKLQDGDKEWFCGYIRRKLENAFDADDTLFAQDQFRGYVGEAPTFSRMLVKLLVEIYSDRLSRTRIKNGQGRTDGIEQPACNGELAEEISVPEGSDPEPEEVKLLECPEPELEEVNVVKYLESVP